MKKLLILTLTLVMVCGTVNAEDVQTEVTAEIAQDTQDTQSESQPVQLTLSLSDAINMALNENPQLIAADIKIESCETSLKAAKETRAKYRSYSNSVAFISSEYGVKAAEESLALAEKEKEKIKSSIAYDVTQKYYTYKLSAHLLTIADDSLSLANENLDVVDKCYELGTISKLEKDNAALSVQSCIVTKNTYTRNLNTSANALKIALNIDYPVIFNLTDDIDYVEYSSDSAVDTASALESRYDMCSLKTASHLALENFNVVKSYNSPNTANYQSAHSQYIQADYTYTNTQKQMALNIQNLYNNILSAKDSIDIANMTYDIQSRNYEAGKLKFEMGTISNIDLTELLNKQSAAGVDVENARLNYKLAVEKYKYEISTGL